jgi:hypothetical protein
VKSNGEPGNRKKKKKERQNTNSPPETRARCGLENGKKKKKKKIPPYQLHVVHTANHGKLTTQELHDLDNEAAEGFSGPGVVQASP